MPLWVILLCAVTMGVGTAIGGWRIVKTMGLRLTKLDPVHGFAAETAAASAIELASRLGIPLSTTHTISTSIMGVGSIRRLLGGPLGRRGRHGDGVDPDLSGVRAHRVGGDDPPAAAFAMTRRRPTPVWRRALQGLAARLVGSLARAAGRLSPRAGARLGTLLGDLAFRVVPGRRRVALDNLALALPGVPEEPRRGIARDNFRHLGVTAVECCQLFFGAPGKLLGRVRVEGVEHMKAALAEGRGAFFLGAHYGNFELVAAVAQPDRPASAQRRRPPARQPVPGGRPRVRARAPSALTSSPSAPR